MVRGLDVLACSYKFLEIKRLLLGLIRISGVFFRKKMTYSFEKLRVWQKSKHFVKAVYQFTSKFPVEEKYGLTSQLRRASVSVSSNIAEGSARRTQKEKRRFYNIAYGSLIEVLNQFLIAEELDYINGEEIKIIRSSISEISWALTALYKTTGEEMI